MPLTMGVEEEFHLVDLKTRRLTARAPELLAELSDSYVAELQRCVVEMNSGVVDTLDGLRADLQAPPQGARRRRRRSSASAWSPPGAVPLSVPAEMQVTQTARYRQMLADYQLLAREQLICGTQVHVGIDRPRRGGRRREPGVAVSCRRCWRCRASSPFWSDGSDTGYSSGRTLVWQRWPTTGLAAPVSLGRRIRPTGRRPGRQRRDHRPGHGVLRRPPGGRRADAGTAGVRQLPVGRHHRADRRPVPGTGRTRGRRGCGRATPAARDLAAAGPRGAVARGPLRAGGRAGRRRRAGAAARAADVVTELVRSLRPQLEAAGDWDDGQRADPAGVDRRHVGGPSAPGVAPPRPAHRCRRPADRRDRGHAGPTPRRP